MKNLAIAQITFSRLLLSILDNNGCSTLPLLKKSGLHRYSLNEDGRYIPVFLQNRFFELVNKQEEVSSMGAEIIDSYRLENLGSWGEALTCSPDFLTACRSSVKHVSAFETHAQVGLQIEGPTSTLWSHYHCPPSFGNTLSEFFTLMLMINAMRLAAGPSADPYQINIPGESMHGLETYLPVRRSQIRFRAPRLAITFPTAYLYKPMGPSQTEANEQKTAPDATLPEQIEKLLDSQHEVPTVNLKYFSSSVGVSPRTLQRALALEDSSFSEIVNMWRFKRALKELSQGSTHIKEISQRLGYANPANFNRAFQRWTGLPPGEYRDLLGLMDKPPALAPEPVIIR